MKTNTMSLRDGTRKLAASRVASLLVSRQTAPGLKVDGLLFVHHSQHTCFDLRPSSPPRNNPSGLGLRQDTKGLRPHEHSRKSNTVRNRVNLRRFVRGSVAGDSGFGSQSAAVSRAGGFRVVSCRRSRFVSGGAAKPNGLQVVRCFSRRSPFAVSLKRQWDAKRPPSEEVPRHLRSRLRDLPRRPCSCSTPEAEGGGK